MICTCKYDWSMMIVIDKDVMKKNRNKIMKMRREIEAVHMYQSTSANFLRKQQ